MRSKTAAPGPTGISSAALSVVKTAPPRKNAMLRGSSSASNVPRRKSEIQRRHKAKRQHEIGIERRDQVGDCVAHSIGRGNRWMMSSCSYIRR